MKLSQAQVEHIAELARLALSPEELELYRDQLSHILEYFERLQELDTDAVEPTASVLGQHSVMREDVRRPPSARDDILENAPAAKDGCFSVPRVLD
jgi:aspartyl-tRNA(Asn)/glutamyl-tRNA(Gln) amidotransferase subunit C